MFSYLSLICKISYTRSTTLAGGLMQPSRKLIHLFDRHHHFRANSPKRASPESPSYRKMPGFVWNYIGPQKVCTLEQDKNPIWHVVLNHCIQRGSTYSIQPMLQEINISPAQLSHQLPSPFISLQALVTRSCFARANIKWCCFRCDIFLMKKLLFHKAA